MSSLTGNGGVSLATSPFSYDLRIYDDEKYIGESYTDIDGLDIEKSKIPHYIEYISTPAPGQVVKYIDFECEPGVKYFDLWYKTDAQDSFAHPGGGAFTVEPTADPEEVQEFFLSVVIVGATVIPLSEKSGHVIEVRDYLERKLTPSYIKYANDDPAQGDSWHYYTAVMTGPDKPYKIRITPLDERYSFFESEYSFNTSYMTSTQFWRTFTVDNTYMVDLRTATTLKVTEGAGLRVFIEKEAHFVPFKEAILKKKGTEGGYDVYEALLPMGFFYTVGGGDSGFLKQTQGISMIRGLESIEITIDAEPLDPDKKVPADPDVSDSMYFNVNDAQHVVLREGESFDILPIRVRQAQTSDTGNDFIEPDYEYEVLGEAEAVVVSADGAPGCEYYNVKWNEPGVAALRFTYGPLQLYSAPIGEGGLNISEPYRTSAKDKHSYWNPTNPIDTGVVIVSSASAEDIEAAGIETNIALGEHDTVYFDRAKTDRAQYTFKPEANGDVTVRVHKPIHVGGAEWGQGWSDGRKNTDGSFTVDLYEGRNIVEVGTDASGYREYHVVNARGVTINIANTSDPIWTVGTPLRTGETVAVSFEGLRLPVEKIAGIYNPGYGDTIYVRYETSDEREINSPHTGRNIVTNNTFKVLLTAPGDLWFTGGCIPTGWLGGALGAHRIKPGTAVYPNMNAGAVPGVFSLLPEIELSVGKESVGDGGDGKTDYTWIETIMYAPGDGTSKLWDGTIQKNIDLNVISSNSMGNGFYITTLHDDVSVWMRRWLSTTSGIPADGAPVQTNGDLYSANWVFGQPYEGMEHTLIEGQYLEGEKAGYVEFTVLPPEDKADYDPTTYAMRRVLNDGIGKHPYIKSIAMSIDDRSYAGYYSGRLKAVDESGNDLGLGWGFLATRTNYVTQVPNNVQSVRLKLDPLVETDPDNASITYATSVTVNGTDVTGATNYLSAPIPLTGNETTITVTATAQKALSGADEPATVTYSIKVLKAGPGQAETFPTRDGETLSIRTPTGSRLTPGTGGEYTLAIASNYRYALEKPGYVTRTGTFSVTESGISPAIDLSEFKESDKVDQTAGTATVTVTGAYYPMAKGYKVTYGPLEAPDLAAPGYVEYNHGGYTVLNALVEAMSFNGVPFTASLGRIKPDDTPEGVYGSGWVCDVNGDVVTDYANTLLSPGDEVYFYYNPNGIGQMFARLSPDSKSVKQGDAAKFVLAGKSAGTDGDLVPIAGASVYADGTLAGTTGTNGVAEIDTSGLSGLYTITAEYNGGGSYNLLTYNEARLTVVKTETGGGGGGGENDKPLSKPADTPTPEGGYTDKAIVTVGEDEVIPVVIDISDGKPAKDELIQALKEAGVVSDSDGVEKLELAVNDAGEVTADTEALSEAIDEALEKTGEWIDTGNLLELPMQVIVPDEEDLAGLEPDAKATVIISSKIDLASRFNGASIGNIVVLKELIDGTVERVGKASSLQAITHGRYIWTDEDGDELPGSTPITPEGEYFFRIAVQDDSLYDMNHEPDVVADPVFLGSSESGGGGDSGGSGGCSSGALGMFGMASLLLTYAVSRGKRRD